MSIRLALALAAIPSVAVAGPCDGWIKKADAASGAALVEAYKGLASCDATAAKDAFPRLMLRATELETLVPLSLAAIASDGFVPVWEMMAKVPYEHRTAVAEQVGSACADQPKVVAFLQGAYVGLKGTDFTSWGPAIERCAAPSLQAWMEGALADPPASAYNEKYNAIVTAWVDGRGVAGLPALEKAAVIAGTRGGPFPTLIEAMTRAVQPSSLREKPKPEDQALLEAALVRVAKAVPPEAAQAVADRLGASGNAGLAASLLPAIHPEAATPDGKVRWAAAAIEACEGEGLVHWATWTEVPSRLDVSEPAKAAWATVKPKLKCGAEGWSYRVTPGPVSEEAAQAWVGELLAQLEKEGTKAKDKQESLAVK